MLRSSLPLAFAAALVVGCSGSQAALDAPAPPDDESMAVVAPLSVSWTPTALADGGDPPLVAVGLVVAEPAPVEDPVQFEAPQAPVRMALSQARRRVVLLPGVGERDASVPAAVPVSSDAAGRVVYSRAIVVVGDDGRREVRYVDSRPGPLDLGAVAGCDGSPIGSAPLRLRGLRATALRRGMRGEAVRVGQHLLCAAGYAVRATGVFDGETDRAVRAFQRAHNAAGRGRALSVDGALGTKTRQALEGAIATRTSG